ncbi:hypothetical protein ACWDNT_00145 [Streptomyces sp. NPDC000963]
MRTALVWATALAVGMTPAVFGAATAVAAPVRGAAVQAGTGTVVQEGGRPTFRVGSGVPAKTTFKVTLPAGATGPVKARLVMPLLNAPADSLPEHVARAFTSTVSVNGSPAVPVAWDLPTGPGSGDDLSLVLDLPAVEAAGTLTYGVTFAAEDWISGYVAPVLDGRFEVTGASTTPVASGAAGFFLDRGTPDRSMRGALHARDANGVLWRYESLGKDDSSLTARVRVGGGWDAYTLITRLTPTRADGEGNLLARDKAGVLWFHEGSGNPAKPFKPRVRISAGWNDYTAITGYEDGMLARDKAGVLWNFEYKDSWLSPTFEPRARVGGGWNVYTAWTGTRDGVLTRDTAGVLWKHSIDPDGSRAKPFFARARVGGGWNTYGTVVQTPDLGRWTGDDLVALDRSGRLWAYDTVYSAVARGGVPTSTRERIGWGWNIYNAVI